MYKRKQNKIQESIRQNGGERYLNSEGEWTRQNAANKIRKMSNAMDLMACSSVIIIRVTQIEHWTLKLNITGNWEQRVRTRGKMPGFIILR